MAAGQWKRPRFDQAAGGWSAYGPDLGRHRVAPRPIARSGGDSAHKREAGRQVYMEHTSAQRATREVPGLGPLSRQPSGCCEAPEGSQVEIMAQRRVRSPARGTTKVDQSVAPLPTDHPLGRPCRAAVVEPPTDYRGTHESCRYADSRHRTRQELPSTVLRHRQQVRTCVARDAHPPRPPTGSGPPPVTTSSGQGLQRTSSCQSEERCRYR